MHLKIPTLCGLGRTPSSSSLYELYRVVGWLISLSLRCHEVLGVGEGDWVSSLKNTLDFIVTSVHMFTVCSCKASEAKASERGGS